MVDFRAGDIIIEYDSGEDEARHALMWVDDNQGKHIVHGKDTGTLLGVVQQSVAALRRDDDDIEYLVYRHAVAPIGALAAAFARRWATRSDDPMVEPMLRYAASQQQHVRARTPFGRRGPQYQTCEAWNAESLVRAVRAWHRGTHGNPLTGRKGVSCSQLVTYCYQAACLQVVLHARYLSHADWQQWLNGPQNFLALKKNGRYQLVADVLQGLGQDLQGFMPAAIRVDAKTTDAENLQDGLEADASFQCVGKVAVDQWARPTQARIEPEDD